MEVDLDNETLRSCVRGRLRAFQSLQEQRQWWAWARAQRDEEETLPMPTQALDKLQKAGAEVRFDSDLERRRLRERYECVRKALKSVISLESKVAALWRELSVENEVLHTILGYGVEGRTMVVTHQMAPTFMPLREFAFKKDRRGTLCGLEALRFTFKAAISCSRKP